MNLKEDGSRCQPILNSHLSIVTCHLSIVSCSRAGDARAANDRPYGAQNDGTDPSTAASGGPPPLRAGEVITGETRVADDRPCGR